MTDEQENNQILTQQPPTISQSIDEFDLPAFTNTDATPAEISPVEGDLTNAPESIATSTEIHPSKDDLTTPNEPTQNSAETSPVADDLILPNEQTENSGEIPNVEDDLTTTNEQIAENLTEIYPDAGDLTTTNEQIENSAETYPVETALTQSSIEIPDLTKDFTTVPDESTAENLASNQSTSLESAAENMPQRDIIIVDTSPEIQPVKIPAIATEDATATSTAIPTANPEPKPTRIWQLLAVFFSGMLVGSVISLGTLLAWRMYQERANLQIKLPADVPLSPSPSPIATAPARGLSGIPPAPGTVSPLPTNNSTNNPTNNSTNIPSPNPTQVPSLSGVPQLASPLPQPSSVGGGNGGGQGGSAPTNSPSPNAESAVIDRVNFEAGATGTTLSNTLPDNKSKRYLIDCRGGQTMTLNVPEGTVSATIIAPNGEKIGTANSTTPWEGQLSASGDYTIEISGESQTNYGVKIEVK